MQLKSFSRVAEVPAQIEGRLHTAFPIKPEHLKGSRRELSIGPDVAITIVERFQQLLSCQSELDIVWENPSSSTQFSGTARVNVRIQPFTVLLQSVGSRPRLFLHKPCGLGCAF